MTDRGTDSLTWEFSRLPTSFPGRTGIGGDIVAVVVAVLLFALLYWSISLISKI